MTALAERQKQMQLIAEAVAAGARQASACRIVGLSARTLQRWQNDGDSGIDRRTSRVYEPAHKLSEAERAELLAVANSAEFAHLPAEPNRASIGRPRRIQSVGIDVLSRPARGRANGTPARRTPRDAALSAASAVCCGTQSALQLGHYLSGHARQRPLLLSLPVHGRLQPQDRRLAGA